MPLLVPRQSGVGSKYLVLRANAAVEKNHVRSSIPHLLLRENAVAVAVAVRIDTAAAVDRRPDRSSLAAAAGAEEDIDYKLLFEPVKPG